MVDRSFDRGILEGAMNEMSAQKRNQPGKLNIQPHPTSLLPISSNKPAKSDVFSTSLPCFRLVYSTNFVASLGGKRENKK